MKFIFFICGIILFVSCKTKSGMTNRSVNDLISQINTTIDSSSFNGVILIKKDSTTIYSKYIGYSDIEKSKPFNENDQFVIGSISKQITAVLLLREFEKGILKLDDKIHLYLPEIIENWSNEVTIHHLLTHTHGITAVDQPLKFKIGTQFEYSQLGYQLIAQILEKVTDKTFQQLSTELFRSYNLGSTFHPDDKNCSHLVRGYEETDSDILEFSQYSLENYAAAGSFISNAEDLIEWNELLHSGKMINIESLTLMKTRYATRIHPVFETIEYGYGLLFNKGEENTQIGALGYAPGFVSASYFYPKSGFNIVILENTARDLDDVKKTFEVHINILDILHENQQ